MPQDYDHQAPQPHDEEAGAERMSKTESLLMQLEEIISRGRQVPFSNQRMVNPEECLILIGRLRDQLPAELRQAKWLLEHNQRTVDDAKLEAERVMRQAETRIAEMIDEHEITIRAQAYAEDTVLAAEESAHKVRERGTIYLENHMIDLENKLIEILNDLRRDRHALRKDGP